MNEGSKLQRAEKARKEYVNTLREKDIILRPTASRVIFETVTGKIVGMPYATRRLSNKGWFMGLPNEYFDFIILLCQADAAPLDFVLPRSFFLPIWENDLYWQYQSSGWQVKFDVKQREDQYALKLKGRGIFSENLQRFLGQTEALSE